MQQTSIHSWVTLADHSPRALCQSTKTCTSVWIYHHVAVSVLLNAKTFKCASLPTSTATLSAFPQYASAPVQQQYLHPCQQSTVQINRSSSALQLGSLGLDLLEFFLLPHLPAAAGPSHTRLPQRSPRFGDLKRSLIIINHNHNHVLNGSVAMSTYACSHFGLQCLEQ